MKAKGNDMRKTRGRCGWNQGGGGKKAPTVAIPGWMFGNSLFERFLSLILYSPVRLASFMQQGPRGGCWEPGQNPHFSDEDLGVDVGSPSPLLLPFLILTK